MLKVSNVLGEGIIGDNHHPPLWVSTHNSGYSNGYYSTDQKLSHRLICNFISYSTKSRCWGLKNQLRNINVGRWNFQNKTIKKMDWPSWTDYDLSGPFQTTFGQFRPYLTLSNHLEPFRTTVDFFGPFQTQQKKSVNGFFWTVPWIPSIKEAQLRFVAQIGEEKQIRAVTLVTGWVTSVTSSRTKF